MKNRILLVVAIAALLALPRAWAQGIATGSLIGHVVSDGQPVSGVTVEATSPALQGKRTTVTNQNGDFSLVSLPPGEYTVQFSLEGLSPQSAAVKVSGAQQSRLDMAMGVAAVTETIGVTAQADAISSSAETSATLTAKMMDQLPVNRDIRGAVLLNVGVNANGPNNAITIAGAQSYENLFLMNGVVINENLRGSPSDLFIEDAIQENTTQISGISAEYGRFAGGVINTITKSGGNTFSGSLRTSLTNDKWAAPTPKTVARNDKVNPVYEGTLGGRIVRDRLWFFGAARSFSSTQKDQTVPTDIPFDYTDEEKRGEAKLTFALNDAHRLVGSYLKIDETERNNTFTDVADSASFDDRTLPQHLLSLNYNGVLRDNLVLEGQYSERELGFVGSGSSTRDRITGTWIQDQNVGFRYNSPTFCGVCGPAETRKNRGGSLKSSWLLSAAGSHDLAIGAETFDDIRQSDNFQSGSNFSIFATDTIVRGREVFPVFLPDGVTWVVYWPILESSKGTHFKTNSAFVNDKWRFNDRLSFNLGVRYDKNDGANSAGVTVTKDSRISPRLGLTYDVAGNGDWLIHASYGHYVTAIANTQGDSSSPNGVPAIFAYFYDGPPINDGNPANPVSTHDALGRLFSWFDGLDQESKDDLLFQVTIPGQTRTIDKSLASPYALEQTVGVSKQLGLRGNVRVDYVKREFRDFYATVIDTTTGQVRTASGRLADFGVLRNANRGLERKYDALLTQFRYRFDRLELGGAWTLSETQGNVNGETAGSGPVSTSILQYPEYKEARWNSPKGDLTTDQRHRVRLWGVFNALDTERNHLTVAFLQRFDSGTPYGAIGSVRSSSFVTNPGYQQRPLNSVYYFTKRDAFRTDNAWATDITVNYAFTMHLGGSQVELFVQPEVLNVFNSHAIVSSADVDTTVLDATNSAGFERFNPFTETPVEGVHWAKGENFGKALSPNAYQTPRTFRLSLGIRF